MCARAASYRSYLANMIYFLQIMYVCPEIHSVGHDLICPKYATDVLAVLWLKRK